MWVPLFNHIWQSDWKCGLVKDKSSDMINGKWHEYSILSIMLQFMMTISNANIFHVTGYLGGEFTSPGEFPTQRRVTRSFDVFFDLSLNKRFSKQSWGWWFQMQSHPLWRHCNGMTFLRLNYIHESYFVNSYYSLRHSIINTLRVRWNKC